MKLLALIAIIGAASPALARDLATVGKTAIEERAFKRAVGQRADEFRFDDEKKRALLDAMVNARLYMLEAAAQGLDKDDELLARLAEQREALYASFFVERTFRERITMETMKAYFAANQVLFSPREVHVEHVVFQSETKAREVLELAQRPGADFTALAKPYIATKNKMLGGDLGFGKRLTMLRPLATAAFATAAGAVHPELVKTKLGFHVLKVHAFRGTDDVKFEAVIPKIEQEMRREVQDELSQRLGAKYGVRVDEEALSKAAL